MTRISLCRLFVGTACLSLTFAGCAATGGAPGASVSETPAAASQELKNPKRLHLAHARWQEHNGDTAGARESYDFVLQEDKHAVEAIVGLARLDHLAGRTDEAERGFLKALELEPDSAMALASAGQFYASHKQWEPAIKMMQAATAADPEDTKFEYHLAVILARSGDIAGARTHFGNVLGDAEAHYNIGFILKESGDLAAAEQEFLQALVKKPELENAKVLLDEIRQARQEKLVLTGAAFPATERGHAIQADYRPGQAPAAPPVVGYQQAPGQTVTAAAHAAAGKRTTAQPIQSTHSAPQRSQPASAIADDSDLTPQQREQLLNQFGQ